MNKHKRTEALGKRECTLRVATLWDSDIFNSNKNKITRQADKHLAHSRKGDSEGDSVVQFWPGICKSLGSVPRKNKTQTPEAE